MQVAGWGIGMARTLYANAVKAIGPDAMVIADPIIPGTRTIVLGLLEDELCRSLINQATATTLIPAPTATVVNSGKGAVVTYAYWLAPGNGAGSPTCGSVSVADSSAAPATLGGVTIDMATQQRSILEGIVSSLRPQIDSIAQSYWQNKTQAGIVTLASFTCQWRDALMGRTQLNQWLAEFARGTGHPENPLFLADVTMPMRRPARGEAPRVGQRDQMSLCSPFSPWTRVA